MAALLKGHLLKVLSRFARDVDANQLKFSSLSQAFLSDLVLNEEVLSNVLELPVWLKLSRAVCNRVSIQIPWTHLSSQPIRINLDEVYVDMETCAELRPFSETPITTSSGVYGRTEMAIDGMLVTVNTVEINFRAPSFHGSIQINRIKVFSTTPDYEPSQDLRMTRLKDESRDAILVFKCVSWQTVRIEAISGANNDGPNRSSIRLITSSGQARIALRKHLSNCELMASRLQILLDDLLWVLTPSQLKSALTVFQELQALASTADTVIRTKKAAKKLKSNLGLIARPKRSTSNSASAKIGQYFDRIDIIETSYHFHLTKLNLHICDEPRSLMPVPPKYEDAAILIELVRMKLDYYPYHIPSMTRRHWLLYREPDPNYRTWQNDILGEYLRQIEQSVPNLHGNPLQSLMGAILVFQVDDFRVNNMTTIHSQKSRNQKMDTDYPLCCSLKKALHLPKNCAAIHMEYLVHYYPQVVPFTAPPHIMHLFCNPVQLTLDLPTLDWFTLVCAETCSRKGNTLPFDFSDTVIPEVVCRCELLMPKTVCPVVLPQSSIRDQSLLYGLSIQSGRVILTNTQTGRGRTFGDSLLSTDLQNCHLAKPSDTFPSLPDDPNLIPLVKTFVTLAAANPMCTLATDLWSCSCDPLWMEFIDLRREKYRPIAFVEPLPVTVWGMLFDASASSKVVFTLIDVAVPLVKIQSTNNGYNTLLRANDLLLKVFDSVMINCADIFSAVREQADNAVLFTGVANVRKVEFSMLSESPGETRGSPSTDQLSDTSQRANDLDSGLRSGGDVPPSSSASLREDFPDFVQRDLESDSMSMRSVMSESSLAEMSGVLDDLSGMIAAGGMELTPMEKPVEVTPIAWELRSPDLAETSLEQILAAEITGIETVFASWKDSLFTKLTCDTIRLKPVRGDVLPNGTGKDHPEEGFNAMDVSPQISLRFQSNTNPDASASALITVRCQDCELECPSEAAGRMGTFFATDLVVEPMPLLLSLKDFKVIFTPENPSVASSGLRVENLTVTRGSDGIFNIRKDDQSYSKNNTSIADDVPVISLQQRILFLKQKQSLIALELQSLQDALQRTGD